MEKHNIDIAILVALAEEFDELLSNTYGAIDIFKDPEYGSYYYRFRMGTEHGAPIEAVACFIGEMGPDRAGRHMERLLQRWSPKITALVGICGAIHGDVSLSDVIVSSRVDAYLSSTKAVSTSDGSFEFEHRGVVYECDHDLVEEARNFAFAYKSAYERWRQDCSEKASSLLSNHIDLLTRKGLLSHRPRIHVGHLASGPVVSAAASFRAWLQKSNSNTKAIEMEAAGVAAAAAERTKRARFISVRGVSDLADERKTDLDKLYSGALRTLAMSNALALLRMLANVGAFSRRETTLTKRLAYPDVDRPSEKASITKDLTTNIITWMLQPTSNFRLTSGVRVLIVEDDYSLRESLCEFLLSMDIDAVGSCCGEDALALLENDNKFHVVVTDIMMSGMDGLEFASYVSKNWPSLPIIIISGWMLPSDLSLPNCFDFLAKPFQFSDLQASIADACSDKQSKFLSATAIDLRPWLYALCECRRQIAAFMRNFEGKGLFETAFRHKLKDSIVKFATSIASEASPKVAIARLSHEIDKLTIFLRSTEVDGSLSLHQFCESFSRDIQKQYKSIDLVLDSDKAIQSQLRPDSVSLICIALIELVDNAIEALNGKGEIRVLLRHLEIRHEILMTVRSNTGPLDNTVAAKVFEEGFSTKGPERGMGLAILYRLVERFDGHLELSQQDGVEFCLSLPCLVKSRFSRI
jgi:nucleoside phosphorylase/FixJ family two-component response regulator/two-component sensor histidine kinase